MSRAASNQVSERERCMSPSLRAVGKAVESWARQSSNGALVWDVVTEYLDDVWFAWESALNSETWWGGTDLLARLDRLTVAIGDPTVGEAVGAAKAVINNYSE